MEAVLWLATNILYFRWKWYCSQSEYSREYEKWYPSEEPHLAWNSWSHKSGFCPNSQSVLPYLCWHLFHPWLDTLTCDACRGEAGNRTDNHGAHGQLRKRALHLWDQGRVSSELDSDGTDVGEPTQGVRCYDNRPALRESIDTLLWQHNLFWNKL